MLACGAYISFRFNHLSSLRIGFGLSDDVLLTEQTLGKLFWFFWGFLILLVTSFWTLITLVWLERRTYFTLIQKLEAQPKLGADQGGVINSESLRSST